MGRGCELAAAVAVTLRFHEAHFHTPAGVGAGSTAERARFGLTAYAAAAASVLLRTGGRPAALSPAERRLGNTAVDCDLG